MDKMTEDRITRIALNHLIKEYREKMETAIDYYYHDREQGLKPNLGPILFYNRKIHRVKQVLTLH